MDAPAGGRVGIESARMLSRRACARDRGGPRRCYTQGASACDWIHPAFPRLSATASAARARFLANSNSYRRVPTHAAAMRARTVRIPLSPPSTVARASQPQRRACAILFSLASRIGFPIGCTPPLPRLRDAPDGRWRAACVPKSRGEERCHSRGPAPDAIRGCVGDHELRNQGCLS